MSPQTATTTADPGPLDVGRADDDVLGDRPDPRPLLDGTDALLAALDADPPPDLTGHVTQTGRTPGVGGPTATGGPADPSRFMTVAGLVLAFLLPVAGLVLSIAAYRWSAQVGHRNTIARTAVVLSATATVVSTALLLALRVLGTPMS